jgi:hypothetical protein
MKKMAWVLTSPDLSNLFLEMLRINFVHGLCTSSGTDTPHPPLQWTLFLPVSGQKMPVDF